MERKQKVGDSKKVTKSIEELISNLKTDGCDAAMNHQNDVFMTKTDSKETVATE